MVILLAIAHSRIVRLWEPGRSSGGLTATKRRGDPAGMFEAPKNRVFTPSVVPPRLKTMVWARILRQDADLGMTTLFFADGELRVPRVDLPVGSAVKVRIEGRDVSVALSRPMDVSIINRLPGEVAELQFLRPPYARATFNLGTTRLHALITRESVERLALVPGLGAWAMIKAVAISDLSQDRAPHPRPWPSDRTTNRETR
jgi:molybdate transport system ATP-binding protein